MVMKTRPIRSADTRGSPAIFVNGSFSITADPKRSVSKRPALLVLRRGAGECAKVCSCRKPTFNDPSGNGSKVPTPVDWCYRQLTTNPSHSGIAARESAPNRTGRSLVREARFLDRIKFEAILTAPASTDVRRYDERVGAMPGQSYHGTSCSFVEMATHGAKGMPAT
jgi:hypothetical protein